MELVNYPINNAQQFQLRIAWGSMQPISGISRE